MKEEANKPQRIGAVILAAGAATRMGLLKQLLPYRGTTLLEHAIFQAKDAGLQPVVVVIGCQAEAVQEAVRRSAASWVVNDSWQSGLGSSIASGVKALLNMQPDICAVAIVLADQPYVSANHLTEMQRLFRAGKSSILASKYAETVGVPAIFCRDLFADLQMLAPDAGARVLLRQAGSFLELYELPEAATDVDTPEDYASVNKVPV